MPAVLFEERLVTSMLFRNIVRVMLTPERLTLSVAFWNLRDIPVNEIQSVHFYRDWLGKEITVEYIGEDGLSRDARWITRKDQQWKQVFAYLGVKLRE
jgi:hypothetical protein